jgi:hypothetical protein
MGLVLLAALLIGLSDSQYSKDWYKNKPRAISSDKALHKVLSPWLRAAGAKVTAWSVASARSTMAPVGSAICPKVANNSFLKLRGQMSDDIEFAASSSRLEVASQSQYFSRVTGVFGNLDNHTDIRYLVYICACPEQDSLPAWPSLYASFDEGMIGLRLQLSPTNLGAIEVAGTVAQSQAAEVPTLRPRMQIVAVNGEHLAEGGKLEAVEAKIKASLRPVNLTFSVGSSNRPAILVWLHRKCTGGAEALFQLYLQLRAQGFVAYASRQPPSCFLSEYR